VFLFTTLQARLAAVFVSKRRKMVADVRRKRKETFSDVAYSSVREIAKTVLYLFSSDLLPFGQKLN